MSHELCMAEGHSLRGARLEYCMDDGRTCYCRCRCGRARQISVWQWMQAGHHRVRWRVRYTDRLMAESHRPFAALEEEVLAFTRRDALHQVQSALHLSRYTNFRASRVREAAPGTAVLSLLLALTLSGCSGLGQLGELLNSRDVTSCVFWQGNASAYLSVRGVTATGGATLDQCQTLR